VKTPELEVSVSLSSVIELVAVGDFGKEGARILGQRVEKDAVDDESKCLRTSRG